MAARSSEFLDVDEHERLPSLHRSRSGGYVDHLEEQTKWDRRDRERQMKRYHDNRHGASSTAHQRSTSNQLAVPIIETNTRRNRSSSEGGRRRIDPSTGYSVQEVRPGPRPVYDYDLTSEPVLPSQVALLSDPRPRHHKKPSIKVQIHQDNPPSSTTSTGPTPRRSPNASPRSPTAQPQLQYQYAALQNMLAQIGTTCGPYLKVEAANPRDLTFSKIAEQVKGFAFDLQVWAEVVGLSNMARIDSRKRKVVEAASSNFDRLMDRATELNEACSQAKPRDLKLEPAPAVDDDRPFKDEEDSKWAETDPTESPGFIIHSCLRSIELQIGTLKRLSRSLQEAGPEAKDEVVAVTTLVEEVTQFFGSQDALDRYAIDPKFAGGKALDEARYTAAR